MRNKVDPEVPGPRIGAFIYTILPSGIGEPNIFLYGGSPPSFSPDNFDANKPPPPLGNPLNDLWNFNPYSLVWTLIRAPRNVTNPRVCNFIFYIFTYIFFIFIYFIFSIILNRELNLQCTSRVLLIPFTCTVVSKMLQKQVHYLSFNYYNLSFMINYLHTSIRQ